VQAVLSVSDKQGIVELGQALAALGVRIFSTGNTQRALANAGVAAEPVSALTGFPELLDGRVKTLHPAIHGGILARRDNPAHLQQLAEAGIAPIDIVVVNLYPFAQTIARPETTLAEALEQIDIGGPTLIRAAAKNFPAVLPLVDPADYEAVLAALRDHGPDLAQRRRLAAKAFAHVAAYDATIASYLSQTEGDGARELPETLTLRFSKLQELRYGENPQQAAAFYREAQPVAGSIVTARQLQGKELSFNNILDGDAALQIVRSFAAPTVAIVKHTNPCGLASDAAGDLVAAHHAARAGDPVSAFGGIVGVNREVDAALAQALQPFFYELIVAPGFSAQAQQILAAKTNLRLLAVTMDVGEGRSWDYRRVSGGLLVQRADSLADDMPADWRVVTQRAPGAAELRALGFAWRACMFVKSNAIVIAGEQALYGMGAGQPSRLDSVLIAARKAGERARGAALASDAFFPKADGVEAAAASGVTAIVQPGGSQGDAEVIAAADALGLAMVFTGRRHFRH
jgi:phosphoribosylaminoimidazolecarboxamide formyltransferase / IMP cyclohydrolase